MIERAFRSVGAARKSPSLHRRRRLRTNIYSLSSAQGENSIWNKKSDDHLFPELYLPYFFFVSDKRSDGVKGGI